MNLDALPLAMLLVLVSLVPIVWIGQVAPARPHADRPATGGAWPPWLPLVGLAVALGASLVLLFR